MYSSGVCSAARLVFANDLLGGKFVLGRQRTAFDDGFGNLGREQANGAQSVIVARDHVIHFVGIAIGVDNRNHRNAQLASFLDGDGFFV